MFLSWQNNLAIPFFAVSLAIFPKAEAFAFSKSKIASLNSQTQFTSRIFDRQAGNLNSLFETKPDPWSSKLLTKSLIASLLAQHNDIDRLQDIKPTDWSYGALKNLIERYGCITGFPDRTFGGEQTVTRAEFAAGLNNCLDTLESLIKQPDTIPQADFDVVLKLMQEFQSDLAILQGKTDGIQARTGDLEASQFSATSKLKGEAILGLGSVLEGEGETVFGSRSRIDLQTSFSGDDRLLTRLSNQNFSGFAESTGTAQGELAFADAEDGFELEVLQYNFGVGDKLNFILGATGIEANDIADTINALDGDGGSGSVSIFGTRNPIYNVSSDAGLGVVHRPSDRLELSAGYLASTAEDPSAGNGLFNGAYSALGQIKVVPVDSLNLAATYIHSFEQSDTQTGTSLANIQSRTANLLGEEISTVSKSYGLELSWAISERLIIGGWGGLSKVSNLDTLNNQVEGGTQNIWNWAATLALPDLGKEGSMGGIVVGSEPKVTSSTIDTDNFREDELRSLHLEAFYQYQVNSNIAITPGVVWITEPDTDTDTDTSNDDLVIGTLRTTFSF